MLRQSYVGDFIFGNSVKEIHQILKTKKPPLELTIYLYNISTREYSPKLASVSEVTNYIRNSGINICDHTVGASLRNNSKKIKNFYIAQSKEQLESIINSRHPVVWWYDTNTNECKELENISASAVGRIVHCPATYVLDCLSGKINHYKGTVFGFSKIECLERAECYMRTKLEKQLDQLEKSGIL